MNRIEINVITGEQKVIPLTDAEIAEAQAKYAQAEAERNAIKQAETAAKQSALSKLTALGLTEAEIKALTGN
jgi:hypothetical protein